MWCLQTQQCPWTSWFYHIVVEGDHSNSSVYFGGELSLPCAELHAISSTRFRHCVRHMQAQANVDCKALLRVMVAVSLATSDNWTAAPLDLAGEWRNLLSVVPGDSVKRKGFAY